ncbi:hypothetical protein PUN28_001633 [Cardiocondyla obscurior]|uniref:Uncharacterized protein n=1 Tax=Cardiocondyla obscurior TaxID=286306 RepID=A0AAW2GQI1_9HYME
MLALGHVLTAWRCLDSGDNSGNDSTELRPVVELTVLLKAACKIDPDANFSTKVLSRSSDNVTLFVGTVDTILRNLVATNLIIEEKKLILLISLCRLTLEWRKRSTGIVVVVFFAFSKGSQIRCNQANLQIFSEAFFPWHHAFSSHRNTA